VKESVLLENYGYIGLFLIAVVGFAFILVLLPILLRVIGIIPHHPTTAKTDTYECGLQTVGKSWVQFNFRYYFFALIFVALDVMVVFLYPWAVELHSLGAFALIVMLIFIAIVMVAFVYAWKKKVLEWK